LYEDRSLTRPILVLFIRRGFVIVYVVNWTSAVIQKLARMALREDAAYRDVTTQTLIPASLKLEAKIISKQSGVVCGLAFAEACFKTLDPRSTFFVKVHDGQWVRSHRPLAIVRGSARAILSAERSALNAVQHLSGIATYTRQQVRRLHSRKTVLYDTRKTLPGWRQLQKYAVRSGGGKNHRMTLRSSVLIKDNHLKVSRLAKTDWMSAIGRLKRRHPSLPVEMEIQTTRDLQDALRLKPDQVLLDNMSSKTLRRLIHELRPRLPGVAIEISGGVRPDQLSALGRLGVERISMGRLTHSAPVFDCSLEITHVYNAR